MSLRDEMNKVGRDCSLQSFDTSAIHGGRIPPGSRLEKGLSERVALFCICDSEKYCRSRLSAMDGVNVFFAGIIKRPVRQRSDKSPILVRLNPNQQTVNLDKTLFSLLKKFKK